MSAANEGCGAWKAAAADCCVALNAESLVEAVVVMVVVVVSEALEVLPGFCKRKGREAVLQDVVGAYDGTRVWVCGKTDGEGRTVAACHVSDGSNCVGNERETNLVGMQSPPVREWWLQLSGMPWKTLQP